ncbi:hypothetical protein, partial [Thiolapillus sp.]|uniref:hypothetical protein n=1 Tax=Thiolapillus sp. TaxID=2017437 RepID=UPI003AF5F697
LLASMPGIDLVRFWFRVLPVRFFRSFLSFLAALFFLRWLILLGRFRFSMLPAVFFSSVFFSFVPYLIRSFAIAARFFGSMYMYVIDRWYMTHLMGHCN